MWLISWLAYVPPPVAQWVQRYILAVKHQVNQRRKRLLIIDYIQKAWSVLGGRDQPEWGVGIDRNRWSGSIGNGGRHQPEYASSPTYFSVIS